MAIPVGASTTVLGLAFAPLATRTGFRAKKLLRLVLIGVVQGVSSGGGCARRYGSCGIASARPRSTSPINRLPETPSNAGSPRSRQNDDKPIWYSIQ